MPQREEKHNKTKKKPPKSPTKKETLLEASCIAKKSFYDNPIMSEKAQQKAPEASVQQEFHCSCSARNETLVIIGWTAAVAAFGPFVFNVLITQSRALTGDSRLFFWFLVVGCVCATAVNWHFYTKKGCERPC